MLITICAKIHHSRMFGFLQAAGHPVGNPGPTGPTGSPGDQGEPVGGVSSCLMCCVLVQTNDGGQL